MCAPSSGDQDTSTPRGPPLRSRSRSWRLGPSGNVLADDCLSFRISDNPTRCGLKVAELYVSGSPASPFAGFHVFSLSGFLCSLETCFRCLLVFGFASFMIACLSRFPGWCGLQFHESGIAHQADPFGFDHNTLAVGLSGVLGYGLSGFRVSLISGSLRVISVVRRRNVAEGLKPTSDRHETRAHTPLSKGKVGCLGCEISGYRSIPIPGFPAAAIAGDEFGSLETGPQRRNLEVTLKGPALDRIGPSNGRFRDFGLSCFRGVGLSCFPGFRGLACAA